MNGFGIWFVCMLTVRIGSFPGSVLVLASTLCCQSGLVSGFDIGISLRIVWPGSVTVFGISFCFHDPFLYHTCVVGRYW